MDNNENEQNVNKNQIVDEQQKKEKAKSGSIVIVIVVAILFGVGGFFLGKSMNNTHDGNQKEETKQENQNNNDEKKEEAVEISIDNNVLETYYKYHEKDKNEAILNGLNIESEIYGDVVNTKSKDVFYVSELKRIPSDFSYKIAQLFVKELNMEYPIDDNIQLDSTEERIEALKKSFNLFFGSNLAFKLDLFYDVCVGLGYSPNFSTINLGSGCGNTSPFVAYYEPYKAEKNDKTLYVYENVTIKDTTENEKEINSLKYKWTYTKGNDDNYYLYSVEKINN